MHCVCGANRLNKHRPSCRNGFADWGRKAYGMVTLVKISFIIKQDVPEDAVTESRSEYSAL